MSPLFWIGWWMCVMVIGYFVMAVARAVWCDPRIALIRRCIRQNLLQTAITKLMMRLPKDIEAVPLFLAWKAYMTATNVKEKIEIERIQKA